MVFSVQSLSYVLEAFFSCLAIVRYLLIFNFGSIKKLIGRSEWISLDYLYGLFVGGNLNIIIVSFLSWADWIP